MSVASIAKTGFACCLAVMMLSACRSSRDSGGPAQKPLPPGVVSEISSSRRIDNRPYEIIWDPRSEEHEPLVAFDRGAAWAVDASQGTVAGFDRSQEVQLWGKYVGKLEVTSTSSKGRVVLRPIDRRVIRDYFDHVQIWVHARYAKHMSTPPDLTVLFADDTGYEFRVPLGSLNAPGWTLLQRKLSPDMKGKIRHPCKFTGLEFANVYTPSPATVYLDSLSFYTVQRKPLAIEPRPSRNIEPMPGQDAGVHTGEDRLPFPTTNTTMQPPLNTQPYQTSAEEDEDGTIRLQSSGPGGDLVYTLQPTGGLASLRATWNGQTVGRLLAGARVEGDLPQEREIVAIRVDEDKVSLEYADGLAFSNLRILGRSLVLDVICPGGKVSHMSLGRLADVKDASSVDMPFMSWGADVRPRIITLRTQGEEDTTNLFATVLVDWYRSNASRFEKGRDGTNDELSHGIVVYDVKTDGRRNDFHERVIVTVAPAVEDVLPSIPHPRAPDARTITHKLWMSAPVDFAYTNLLQSLRTLRDFDVTNVIVSTGRGAWQDTHESFSFRTRAAPGRGGDAALSWFGSNAAGMGFTHAIFANYCEMSPLSGLWKEDEIQLMGDGSWRQAPAGNFAVKAPRANTWLQQLAPEIVSKFSPGAVYMDAHAGVPPWAGTDFDERVPGAGTFTQPYYCYGELMVDAAKQYAAPVIGAGGNQLMYAGLSAGHVGAVANEPAADGDPLLPIFYLHRIGPLEVGFGMGTLASFAGDDHEQGDNPGALLDRYLAAQIAYGHAGRLFPDAFPTNLLCRSYYMMQALQQRYLLRTPKRIAYWDGRQLLSASDAMTQGATRHARIYIHYEGDLEVWVNGSDQRFWSVRVGRDTWELPPSGWVAQAPGFLELSAQVDGERLDYVASDAYTYYDGRGRMTRFNGLSAAGPVVLRYREKGETTSLDILDVAMAGSIVFTPRQDLVGVTMTCKAYASDGRDLGAAPLVAEGEAQRITRVKGARRYVVEFVVDE